MGSIVTGVTPAQIPYGTLLVDPNGWTTIAGIPTYDDAQYRLVRELDSRHIYFTWNGDDGYAPNAWQVGSSDPYQTDAWSPYGSPSPVANRRPFPGW
jgi:hypothetical protein